MEDDYYEDRLLRVENAGIDLHAIQRAHSSLRHQGILLLDQILGIVDHEGVGWSFVSRYADSVMISQTNSESY